MTLSGKSIIGFGRSAGGGSVFRGINAATGEPLEPEFESATSDDADRACRLAGDAVATYAQVSGRDRGRLLRAISARLEEAGDALVARAQFETALPEPRLRSELGRTCGQLRMFAALVEDGSWVDARIDRADPERRPASKPDIRSMLRPVGPVAVFGASNFPLAFSVAGGDTASALAAGCPVVVKAHPAHPGTSELAGLAVRDAAREQGLPEGVFSLLFDSGYEIGLELVRHPAVKAVGFTGSRRGGLALMDAAAWRPDPIPVFAEMGSINPVFVLPSAMRERGTGIAAGLHASVTAGVGQFCTNPGLVVAINDESAKRFITELEHRIRSTPEAPMLTKAIRDAYMAGVASIGTVDGVAANQASAATSATAGAALFCTSGATFLSNENLMSEVFGPSTLVVQCEARDEMLVVARALEGQLTATIHADERGPRAGCRACGIARTKGGADRVQRFPDRRRSMSGNGPRGAVPGDVGRPVDLGRYARDRALLARRLLSGLARCATA